MRGYNVDDQQDRGQILRTLDLNRDDFEFSTSVVEANPQPRLAAVLHCRGNRAGASIQRTDARPTRCLRAACANRNSTFIFCQTQPVLSNTTVVPLEASRP